MSETKSTDVNLPKRKKGKKVTKISLIITPWYKNCFIMNNSKSKMILLRACPHNR